MGAVRARVRADLRRRWLAWLALALTIGIAGAVVLTAAAGTRRTDTAFDRFLEQGHAEDLYFSTGRPSDPETKAALDEIEALPQVEVAGHVGAMTVYGPDSGPGSPYQFAGADARYGSAIDRPNIVEGRRPDPDRADEVLVNRELARTQDIEAGDTVEWYAFEPAEIDVAEPKISDATRVKLRVVGIGVYPNEVVPTAQYDSLPFMYLTPAYFRAHSEESQEYAFGVVRLRNGGEDVAAFRRGMARVIRAHGADPNDMFFTDRSESYEQVRRAITPQALALGIFAGLTAAAFVMVIVQVLSRRIFVDAAEHRALVTLGMTRAQLFATSMTRVVVVAVVGGVLAVAGAWLASPLMPIGPARLAEPNPGMALDVAAVGLGALVLVALVVLLAAVRPGERRLVRDRPARFASRGRPRRWRRRGRR